MRLLWVGDGPLVPSAYGGQAALFIPRLRAAGHTVALLATGGSAGATYRTPAGLTVYPTVGDPHGNDIVGQHAREFGADVVLTIGDAHVLDPDAYGNLPWVAWAPLDFEAPTKATLRSLRAAKHVWSPSYHGEMAYRRAGLEHVTRVPHGIDSAFRLGDRNESRRVLEQATSTDVGSLGDKFIIAVVAANKGTPSRKGFYETFAAFARYVLENPRSILYLHTDRRGVALGEDLDHIAGLCGLRGDPRILYPPQYKYLTGGIAPAGLAHVYRAADVLLSTSHGEGFSLPLYEGQRCGCPVIAPNNTAQTEALTESHGVACVPVIPYMPWNGAGLWGRPLVADTVHALRAAREFPRAGAMTEFDADVVFQKHFLPALEEV